MFIVGSVESVDCGAVAADWLTAVLDQPRLRLVQLQTRRAKRAQSIGKLPLTRQPIGLLHVLTLYTVMLFQPPGSLRY